MAFYESVKMSGTHDRAYFMLSLSVVRFASGDVVLLGAGGSTRTICEPAAEMEETLISLAAALIGALVLIVVFNIYIAL